MAKTLTAISIANERAGEDRKEISDGGCTGLYLVIQPSGHKSWCVRFRYRGAPRKLTLGPVLSGAQEPDTPPEFDTPLSLASARQLATTALRQAKSGTDPTAHKRKRREQQHATETDTLKAISEEYLRREGGRLRTVGQRSADLKLLYPSLGRLPINEIRRGQYVRLLDQISDKRGPVRSDRVLGALSALLGWHAKRSEFVSPLVRGMRKTKAKDLMRHRTLSDEELRTLWTTADTFGTFGGYLQFLLLTATRRNEAADLCHSELNHDHVLKDKDDKVVWKGTLWTIPGARAKNKLDQVIPLSARAQQIVAEQPRISPDFVFSITGDNGITSFHRNKTRFDAVSGLKNWRLHDLRRTARTLLSRAGVSADIAEKCLGHMPSSLRQTYDKFEYSSEKALAFEALATQIERIVHPPDATVSDISAERAKRRTKRR
jgi:integrase